MSPNAMSVSNMSVVESTKFAVVNPIFMKLDLMLSATNYTLTDCSPCAWLHGKN
jgi:hypothetical protein